MLDKQAKQYAEFFKSLLFCIWVIISLSLNSGTYADGLVSEKEQNL